jgi:hypothetical protein
MRRVASVVLWLAILLFVAVDVRAAEERTVKATAAWDGQGRFIATGTDYVYFTGALSGTVFVDGGGMLNGAKLLCLGHLEVVASSGKQEGEGRCQIGDAKGNQLFARWQCSGTHQVSCKGRFTITGGSGQLKGITGEGEMIVRTTLADVALGKPGEGNVQETGAGLIEWPALHYRIP